MDDRSKTNPGIGVDASGGPVIDPTKNVLDFVEAAIRRQDDLRKERKEWITAKLDAIHRELDLVESRRVEQKTDTKTAVDDALRAAERAVREQVIASDKAVLKSENAASEQFSQQRETTAAQIKSVEIGVADLKDRLSKMETFQQTKTEDKNINRLNVGMVVGIILAIFGFISLVLAVATVDIR